MSPSVRAMLWELFRTGRMDLLARIGYGVAIVVALNSIGQLAQEDLTPMTRGLLLLISIAMSVFSLFWIRELDRGQTGFRFRMNFARPISTLQLVGVPMLFTVTVSAICFLVPTQIHRFLTGTPTPIAGPIAFVACTVVCLTGAAWSAKTLPDRIVALAVLIFTAVCTAVVFHQSKQSSEPYIFAVGDETYFHLSWLQYAVLIGTALLAFLGTVVAVDMQRHGDGLSVVEPIQSLLRGTGVNRTQRRKFRGPTHAQFAYEFRRCTPAVLTLGLIGPLGVYAFIRFGYWMNPDLRTTETIWKGGPVMWMLGLGLSPFIYQLLGADAVIGLRKRGDVYRLSAFDATRPMTNDQLIAIKLIVVAVCSLVAWACMWAAALLFFKFELNGELWSKVVAELDSLSGGGVRWPWLLAGLSCATLFYVGSTSILLSFGLTVPFYPRVFVWLMGFGYANFGLAFMDAKQGWKYLSLWQAYGYVVAGVLGALCLFAIWLAIRQRAMSGRSMLVVGTLWAIFVGTVVVIAQRVPSIGTPLQLVTVSLMLVPLAATVSGPLALGLQRHRP